MNLINVLFMLPGFSRFLPHQQRPALRAQMGYLFCVVHHNGGGASFILFLAYTAQLMFAIGYRAWRA